MNTTKKHHAFEKACGLIGGQTKMARLLNVKPPTVNQWVHLVKQIPAERCPKIERFTHGAVTCEELRPDVDWAYLRGSVVTSKPEAAGPAPAAEEAEVTAFTADTGKILIMDTPDRRDVERRHGERRNSYRRCNSNGGGRRIGERRVADRRVDDRRE